MNRPPDRHQHRWAIVEEYANGGRLAACSICYQEKEYPPDTLFTRSEREALFPRYESKWKQG